MIPQKSSKVLPWLAGVAVAFYVWSNPVEAGHKINEAFTKLGLLANALGG